MVVDAALANNGAMDCRRTVQNVPLFSAATTSRVGWVILTIAAVAALPIDTHPAETMAQRRLETGNRGAEKHNAGEAELQRETSSFDGDIDVRRHLSELIQTDVRQLKAACTQASGRTQFCACTDRRQCSSNFCAKWGVCLSAPSQEAAASSPTSPPTQDASSWFQKILPTLPPTIKPTPSPTTTAPTASPTYATTVVTNPCMCTGSLCRPFGCPCTAHLECKTAYCSDLIAGTMTSTSMCMADPTAPTSTGPYLDAPDSSSAEVNAIEQAPYLSPTSPPTVDKAAEELKIELHSSEQVLMNLLHKPSSASSVRSPSTASTAAVAIKELHSKEIDQEGKRIATHEYNHHENGQHEHDHSRERERDHERGNNHKHEAERKRDGEHERRHHSKSKKYQHGHEHKSARTQPKAANDHSKASITTATHTNVAAAATALETTGQLSKPKPQHITHQQEFAQQKMHSHSHPYSHLHSHSRVHHKAQNTAAAAPPVADDDSANNSSSKSHAGSIATGLAVVGVLGVLLAAGVALWRGRSQKSLLEQQMVVAPYKLGATSTPNHSNGNRFRSRAADTPGSGSGSGSVHDYPKDMDDDTPGADGAHVDIVTPAWLGSPYRRTHTDAPTLVSDMQDMPANGSIL